VSECHEGWIGGLYTGLVVVINLVLFGVILLVLPITQAIFSQTSHQLPGLAQLFVEMPLLLAIGVSMPSLASVLAIAAGRRLLFHSAMALSIVVTLFLLLGLMSVTVLPLLQALSVVR